MPDDPDYEWLARTLSRPEEWTDKDRDVIVFLLRQARDSLAKTPSHHRGDVERLGRSIELYEAAISRYETARSR